MQCKISYDPCNIHMINLCFFRCLLLLEDFDRDEFGRLGSIGGQIQSERFEALVDHVY
jgi:hypothetical protein